MLCQYCAKLQTTTALITARQAASSAIQIHWILNITSTEALNVLGCWMLRQYCENSSAPINRVDSMQDWPDQRIDIVETNYGLEADKVYV